MSRLVKKQRFCSSSFYQAGAVARAQLPSVRHVPWDLSARDSVAIIDRHVLGNSGSRFARLTDNRDRVHLSIRFAPNGYRSIGVAVPHAWVRRRLLPARRTPYKAWAGQSGRVSLRIPATAFWHARPGSAAGR